jgi:hypothetical protein
VKQDIPSSNKYTETDWQNLGKLELPTGHPGNGAIEPWIIEILEPLIPPADFLRKLISSANQAVDRVIGSMSHANEENHILLRIFAPNNHTSQGQTWGFFRIEKTGLRSDFEGVSPHLIDFYLYLENR